MAMPSTVKPLAAYFCCISISQGISAWQGSHQVAQKFTRTTLPLYWARERSLPSRSFRVTSGAGFGALGLAAELPAETLRTPFRGWRGGGSARLVAGITAADAT